MHRGLGFLSVGSVLFMVVVTGCTKVPTSRISANQHHGSNRDVTYHNTVTTSTLSDVKFYGANDGWAISTNGGAVLTTNHGGQTWTNVSPKLQKSNRYTFFLNATTAWIATSVKTSTLSFYRTTDKGQKWTKEGQLHPKYPEGGVKLCFTSASKGYVENYLPGMGPMRGVLYRTVNGGQSWTQVSVTPKKLPSYTATTFLPIAGGGLLFSNFTDGWAYGSPRGIPGRKGFPLLFQTRNGAKSWQPVHLPIAAKYKNDLVFLPILSHLVTTNDGLVALLQFEKHSKSSSGDNHRVQKLFLSKNNGRSWTVKTVPQQPIHSIQFVDDMHGWDLLNNGELYSTKNSGHTWVKIHHFSNATYTSSLQFISDTHGFVLLHGKLYTTENGGHTWTKRP